MYLEFVRLLTGANGFFLGLTVLAMGNSVGDAFSYVGAARQGMGKVAVSGIYGGQLFNLLMGFGLGAFFSNLRKGSPI